MAKIVVLWTILYLRNSPINDFDQKPTGIINIFITNADPNVLYGLQQYLGPGSDIKLSTQIWIFIALYPKSDKLNQALVKSETVYRYQNMLIASQEGYIWGRMH